MEDTNARPAGSRSCTVTLVAAFGPLFTSVTVNVTVSPTFGAALLTDLASAKSACCGVTVALAVLLAGLGSDWSEARTAAVLTCRFALATVAWICNVGDAPVVTVPTVQIPVPLA
ncbi:MAG: hypothetical protein J7556_09440 [Acidovorax sp.]|nr:hypothetical protein [Acidovorax sp.]